MKPDFEQISDYFFQVYFQGKVYSVEYFKDCWSIMRHSKPLYSSDTAEDCIAWLLFCTR